MNRSSAWLPSDYIKEFAKESASRFVWKHFDHYTRALFNALIVLKRSGKFPDLGIRQAEQVIEKHHNLFKLLGMFFVKEALENNKTSFLLASNEGYKLRVCDDLLAVSVDRLLFQLSLHSSAEQLIAARRVINSVHEGAKIYCWLFLSLANQDNIMRDLVEELYILIEVQAFEER